MSKMTFIQNDRLVFPTMADKKMYFTISGVKLNHGDLRFERNKNGGISVNFNDGVAATMRGYLYDDAHRPVVFLDNYTPRCASAIKDDVWMLFVDHFLFSR